jgi:hypothetical protein
MQRRNFLQKSGFALSSTHERERGYVFLSGSKG